MSTPTPSREPVVRGHRAAKDGIELALSVPESVSYFSGHFPGHPILPGVVQIDWALSLARRYALIPEGAAAAIRVKFSRPIRPGTDLMLSLAYSRSQRQLEFEYRDDQFSYGSGRIELGGDGL